VTRPVDGGRRTDSGEPPDPREFSDGGATVLISNRQDVAVDEESLGALAITTLRGEGVERFELSVSLVDTDEMADLHKHYLGEPGATDVLSFPLEDEDEDGVRLLGDVVICPAYGARQGGDLQAEVRLLLVHGILHLLGHDHEEDAERAEMWSRQERYSGVAVDASGDERTATGAGR
jgi:probable rRNA maturation factor